MNVAASRYGHPRVPCSIFIQWELAAASCGSHCVGVLNARTRFARVSATEVQAVRTHKHTRDEHVRNMRPLLPALPMSALASRWIARQNVYSNVANDVDWLASTSTWFFFFLASSSSRSLHSQCAIRTHLITVVVVIRLSGRDDGRCVAMQHTLCSAYNT